MPRKNILTLIISLAVCGLGFLGGIPVYAGCPGDPQCLTPIQITHSAHNVLLDGFTSRNPWNYDFTKIALREDGYCYPNPTANPNCHSTYEGSPTDITNQNPFWANLADLIAVSGGTVQQYEAARHQIFPNANYLVYSNKVVWGRTLAEKDIAYGIKISTKQLVRADTSTIPSTTSILTTLPDINNAGGDTSMVFDWTTDGNLIVINNYTSVWKGSGYEINVQFGANLNCNLTTPTLEANGCRKYTSWPAVCTADNNRFASRHPMNEHFANITNNYLRYEYGSTDGTNMNGASIHDATDPNCNTKSSYDSGPANWPDLYTIGSGVNQYRNSPTHCSGSTALSTTYGYTNNDWAVCGTLPETWPINWSCKPPYLDNVFLYKITVDTNTGAFTREELMSHNTAAYTNTDSCGWSNASNMDNYMGGILNPVLRRDSNQVMFLGTNGNYSEENWAWCAAGHGGANCAAILAGQNEGHSLWIVDLDLAETNPADVDGSGGVNIKDIQACIKVITRSDLTYENQCKVLAASTGNTNIKDIQVIIREIIS